MSDSRVPSALPRPALAEDRPPELLHELFERQARLRPSACAVLFGSQTLTYDELDQRATAFAALLQERGIGRGDCVGLFLPRSVEVYVGMLGILKAGAAYVPLDPEYPAERVCFILSDCRARAVVTNKELASHTTGCDRANIILNDSQVAHIKEGRGLSGHSVLASANEGEQKLSSPITNSRDQAASPNDLCYIIYTSGTTGKPKGVQIEHRSACHLVRVEAEIFQVKPEDRVYQGFSIAFDASVEEIWLAFNAGATLVAGTREMVRAGADLAPMLAAAGVTVLSCVPTLLLMMDTDIPSVRLLILGGEACPPELIRRWWTPKRRVVNTYGPTEATIIATYAECHPEKPVTIGRPIQNYTAFILDGALHPAPSGTSGELCLGGIGLARGYVGKPELTAEKFVTFSDVDGRSQRLYRTGDLCRWTTDGEIEFLGRIDTQVKIRGFRVELGEIEAALLDCPGIKAAAVALREDLPGIQQLVGYFVTNGAAQISEENVRERLRKRLPPYMIPAVLERLPQLPTLPSGKVDRKSLPPPRAKPAAARADILAPRNAVEQQIGSAWQRLLGVPAVSISDDFFLDLGGHSLLAARMVSELRRSRDFERISVLDVYKHPTIESLARAFEPPSPGAPASLPASAAKEKAAGKDAGAPRSIPFLRHFLCGSAQLVSLVFILSFFALQWLAPYLAYTILIEEEYDFIEALLGAFASLIVFYPIMLMIPIIVKWLIIGRYHPGAYPLWGFYYFRWWLVTTIEAAVPVGYLTGTPLLGIYLRLMGAKIGRNVHLDSDTFAIYDLLSIGDDSSVNVDSNLLGYTVENGQLKLGRINIGRHCFVGARAALREDTTMEDESALEDLSFLASGQIIPNGETWRGSPAQLTEQRSAARPGPQHSRTATDGECVSTSGTVEPAAVRDVPRSGSENLSLLTSSPTENQTVRTSLLRRFLFGMLHAIGLLIFPVLVVAALFPGIVVMNELNYLDPYYWYLLLAPLVGFSFIGLLALEIAAIKWLLLGKVKPGSYPLHSFYYLRKWFFDQTMDLSLDILGPLYASVYLTPWYKLLGARLGRGAEVSTASFISPDLLSIGEESFIADSVSLGAPRVRDGFVTIGHNRIGRRSFIGNSAMLPPNTVIGDSVLIGCLSAPPPNPTDALREDSSWMGSPPFFLPQRQKSAGFAEETTFDPTVSLRVQRAIIEFIRVILPSTGFIILLSLLFSALLLLNDEYSMTETLLFFPVLYIGCAVAATLFTIIMKWLLVGRYKPGEKPLWNNFVWRNELLNALHEHLAEPFLVGALTGTPFVCWYFRLLGARIGRRVYMETTDFSEFDLAAIGDEAVLNADCTIQTHLFEDRVMKMSTIEIGPRCVVGAGSLVLYDTRMEAGASLGDLSLLMKGEVLPASTAWQGIPARPA